MKHGTSVELKLGLVQDCHRKKLGIELKSAGQNSARKFREGTNILRWICL